jgi:hypothetical protein
MSTFKPLQPKRCFLSTPTAPTSSLLRPSRPLVPTSPPASEPVAPLTQKQLEHTARLGHSLERFSIFPPEKKNSTGLPDTLKTGIEKFSGISLDDVHVHYNSSKPAQMQALAYTQGTEIHVGPGQEQHLAHEAWHVVQQKQGRVKPTLQVKGMTINDDAGLEKEADDTGAKALQSSTLQLKRVYPMGPGASTQAQLQGAFDRGSPSLSQQASSGVIQMLKHYYNTQTERAFTVDESKGLIKAQEVEVQEGGHRLKSVEKGHSGYLTYSFLDKEKAMVLEHLESHPPEGSGIGSLLVFLLAQKAEAMNFPTILVSKPATNRQSFYQQMGFGIEEAKQKIHAMYREAGREPPEEITVTEARASTTTILENAGISVAKRWRMGSTARPAPRSPGNYDPTFGQSSRLVASISNEDL